MEKTSAKELLDLALHPVRMRILTLLSGNKGLTTQQMAGQMSDVPQATLYRHITRLVQGGMLVVVEERPVRGTLEKVYAMNTAYEQQLVSGEEALDAINRMAKEDHLRYFTAFTMSLLHDFSDYLTSKKSGQLNMAVDGVGYHKLALFLSDEEFVEFAAALNQALVPYLAQKNAPGRKKRLFSTIMMPAENQALEDLDRSEACAVSTAKERPDRPRESRVQKE